MPTVYYSYYTPIASSLSTISKQEHTLGRILLTQGINDLLHISLSCDELENILKYDTYGKPYFPAYPEVNFNITHCNGFVACAFHEKPIGIDAELPDYFPEVLISRALTENEKCFLLSKSSTLSKKQEWFYRFWTLKEAYVKKSGIGVDTILTDFSFSFIDNKQGESVICSDPSVYCYQTQMAHGQILSLCYDISNDNIELISCSLPHEQLK